MAKVAWIGLGVMGYPMAGHILKKGGHDLVVYNRTLRRRRTGSPSTARAGPLRRRRKRPRGPISCSAASATTMICGR